LGFNVAFYALAGIAAMAATLFVFFMSETNPNAFTEGFSKVGHVKAEAGP
jgi:hypothetical protein